MITSLRFERTVKNNKPLNRAQRILRKNRETFPKWYWRIIEEHSFETITFSWYIPRAEVTVGPDGRFKFDAIAEGILTKES